MSKDKKQKMMITRIQKALENHFPIGLQTVI
jgi:hypothetical protein